MKILLYILASIALVIAVIWYFPMFTCIVGILCAVIGAFVGEKRGVGLGGAIDYWIGKAFTVFGAFFVILSAIRLIWIA
jgi:hypothetical protein